MNGLEGFIYSFLFYFYYRMLVDIKIYEFRRHPDNFDNSLTSLE
jgi:hypothetical protein